MYDIPILPSCLHWWDCCWHWAVHKRPLSSLNWTHDIHWNVKTILSILSQHLFWVKYFKTIHKNVLMLLWVLTPCFLVSFSQQHIFKQNTILNSYLLWDFLKTHPKDYHSVLISGLLLLLSYQNIPQLTIISKSYIFHEESYQNTTVT